MFKMNHRRLSFRNHRAVGCPRSRDWYLVRDGKVETGSEWDGMDIRDVYRAIRPQCASRKTALALTASIWKNRVHALREQRRNGRDKLDQALSGVRAEEPWALEDPYQYFEDEVSDG